MSQTKQGLIYAGLAYAIWGFMPVFYAALDGVNTTLIIAHRILWSFVILAFFMLNKKSIENLKNICTKKNIFMLFLSSCLISINWFTYVWAIDANKILDASLGYFINPIVNVLIGLVFFKERLNIWQSMGVGLAFIGVGLQIFSFGVFPFVALILAFSFGFYGAIRKQIAVDAKSGLFIETALMLIPALVYIVFFGGNVLQNGWFINLFLVLSGLITTLPLVLFASAALKLKLSVMGILQYTAPSVQMLLAVFIFGENFDNYATFIFIWLGLFVFSFGSFKK